MCTGSGSGTPGHVDLDAVMQQAQHIVSQALAGGNVSYRVSPSDEGRDIWASPSAHPRVDGESMPFQRTGAGIVAVLVIALVAPALGTGTQTAGPPGSPALSVSHRCSGRIRMRGLNFGPDTAVIAGNNSAILNEVVKELMLCPSRSVRIEGHTDARGSDAHNQKLSEDRALAVKHYLIDHGIDPKRLTAIGYGKTRPIAHGDTVEAQRQNRRVAIIFER